MLFFFFFEWLKIVYLHLDVNYGGSQDTRWGQCGGLLSLFCTYRRGIWIRNLARKNLSETATNRDRESIPIQTNTRTIKLCIDNVALLSHIPRTRGYGPGGIAQPGGKETRNCPSRTYTRSLRCTSALRLNLAARHM